MSDNQDKVYRELVNDDEFVALMEAQFNKEQAPVDELEKARIWRQLQGELPQQTRTKPQWLGFAVAAMLALLILPIALIQNTSDDITRVKGETQAPGIYLHAFVLQADNSLQRVDHTVNVGDTLLFKVGVTEAVTAAIVLSENSSEKKIRFVSQTLAPGMDQLVLRGENTYGYKVEVQHQQLEFCALAAYDPKQFEQYDLRTASFKVNQCTQLHVNK